MDVQSWPRPPGLDAGAEAWDAFMLTQHETIMSRIRAAEEQARSQGVVTRAGLRKQNGVYDLRRRLMLSAIKNEVRYKGRVIDAQSGSALRTYICEWEDIPEKLSGIEKQKEHFVKEGDHIMVQWLGTMQKIFTLKRRQWFEDGRFHIHFDDPMSIGVNIDSKCLHVADDEASRTEICKPQSPPAANLSNEHICGRALGIHFMQLTGELYIADAYHGLRVVGPNGGEAKLVVGEAEGVPFHFTNDVEISSDGLVYFSDSSANYRRRQFFLAAFSGDDSGRIVRYNPSTKEVKVLYKGIQFPNGLALSKDESFLVVAETTTCRLSRYWLKGEKAGTMETFAQLPGPPDNVRVNEAGEFWVAIHCRQTLPVWAVFSYPWIRYAIMKLPVPIKYIYPFFLGGKPHAMIARYDAHGNVLEVLEDQTGKLLKLISEVEERDGELWLGSVLMPYVAVYSR